MGTSAARASVVVLAWALAACVSDAQAHEAPRDGHAPASPATTHTGVAQTGPTMGTRDAGMPPLGAGTMPEPRDCTPTWSPVRERGPRLPRAATACEDDAECGVAKQGQCCGPCGAQTVPIARARAVNVRETGGVSGCPMRTGYGCPACAGRYVLEPGYDVVCASRRCTIMRATVPSGCALPTPPDGPFSYEDG